MVTTLTLLLAACGSPDTTQRLTITGSSTIAPLAAELAAAFEKSHQGVRIDVQTGGSSRGVNDVRKQLADIGMASRSLKASEQALLSHTIAWDGITLILHRDNPVTTLSDQQVQAIYQGRIRNWSAVGGPDRAITVVNKAEGRSTLELFLDYFELDSLAVKADVIIGDNQQGLKLVAGNPWAIAYVSIGAARYEADHGAPIRVLPVNGVEATLANVEQGRFPIARPLNLVTYELEKGSGKGAAKEVALAKAFIRYAQSSAAAAIIKQQFFIPARAQ